MALKRPAHEDSKKRRPGGRGPKCQRWDDAANEWVDCDEATFSLSSSSSSSSSSSGTATENQAIPTQMIIPEPITGCKGVSEVTTTGGKDYHESITVEGKKTNLGTFHTAEAATVAYDAKVPPP